MFIEAGPSNSELTDMGILASQLAFGDPLSLPSGAGIIVKSTYLGFMWAAKDSNSGLHGGGLVCVSFIWAARIINLFYTSWQVLNC